MTAASGARDERWFEDLYVRFKARVWAYAIRRVPDDADDVVTQVFAVAWRKREEVPDSCLPWLYAVAARETLHVLRTRQRSDRLVARLSGRGCGVVPDHSEAAAGRVDAANIVSQVMHSLSAKDAEVLRLWAWEQLEPAEISVVLGITPAAARVRLHRARRRLESRLTAAASRRTPLLSRSEPSYD
ncbi:RNA polymerase sigma factor [Terrabacter sp. RAF57]|uniref:RNA polymerase sigma factor n=1 Tax=Terrabacter sp. RAF57 TaxID=3233063 RepID=UPI003F9567D3